MYRELESKTFEIKDYKNQDDMEIHIKEYINKLKKEYPYAVVTREFYKMNGALVRATMNGTKTWNNRKYDKLEQELELARIKEYRNEWRWRKRIKR